MRRSTPQRAALILRSAGVFTGDGETLFAATAAERRRGATTNGVGADVEMWEDYAKERSPGAFAAGSLRVSFVWMRSVDGIFQPLSGFPVTCALFESVRFF